MGTPLGVMIWPHMVSRVLILGLSMVAQLGSRAAGQLGSWAENDLERRLALALSTKSCLSACEVNRKASDERKQHLLSGAFL